MDVAQPKILLVEDELALSSAMSARLRLDGLETVQVYNGLDAIEALKTGEFSLVVLDLMLPDISGFQVLEKMNAMNMNTPVIVTTVLSQPEDEHRAMSLGAKEYLRKGEIPLVSLVGKVRGYLNSVK